MSLFNHNNSTTQHISILERIMHSIAHIFHFSSKTTEAVHQEIDVIKKDLSPLEKMVENIIHNGTHVIVKLAEEGVIRLLEETKTLVKKDVPGPIGDVFDNAITDAENSINSCMGASSNVTVPAE